MKWIIHKPGWFSCLNLALLFFSSLLITEMHMHVLVCFLLNTGFFSFSCGPQECDLFLQKGSGKDSWQICFFWSNYCECPCTHLFPSVVHLTTWLWFFPGQKELVIFPFLVLLFSIPVARHIVWLKHLHGFNFLWGGFTRHAASPWNEVSFLTA